jgi:hypothetical protein
MGISDFKKVPSDSNIFRKLGTLTHDNLKLSIWNFPTCVAYSLEKAEHPLTADEICISLSTKLCVLQKNMVVNEFGL